MYKKNSNFGNTHHGIHGGNGERAERLKWNFRPIQRPALALDPFQAQGGSGGYQFDVDAYRTNAFAPYKAGFLNLLGGLYSWQHGDTFGGALTAGLEGAGLLLTIIGAVTATPDSSFGYIFGTMMGGGVIFIAGETFGFIRGMGQYKKQNAVASGFDGNPLEKVSFGFVPGMGGSIVYSTSF